MVKAEAGDQSVRVKIRETSPARRGGQGLIILGDHGIEVFSGCRIDFARLGVIHSKIQADTIPNLEWIAREQVEA